MRLFNRITIKTPESVELEFTLAGIGNRGVALIVDYLIWNILLILVLLLWAWISFQIQDYFLEVENLQLWLTGIALLLVFVVYTCYFVCFETLWQGQTPGKRYAKIRVVRDNGQPVGLTQALLRSLLRTVDDLLFLGMFCIIFGTREKRLGDWAAGTIVIQEDRPVASADIQVSDQAQDFAIQLLAEHNIGALMPDDFAVIREYLQRRTVMDSRSQATIARKLAEQACQLIGMPQVPFDLSPELLLEGMYLAYQQQNPS